MTIKDFCQLDVYKSAFAAAMQLFELSKRWPPEERYSLTSQIRRSSRSICGNIAEAWRKGRYPAAFCSKLSDTDGEAGETIVWIEFALNCGYLDRNTRDRLIGQNDHICARLVTLINQREKWCA